ncbi:MAG TPA: hypothetical protein PKC90_13385, partial [Phycisphaerales bacterium]|nr:hypothetical protein [Phycisphaerales bacterium]
MPPARSTRGGTSGHFALRTGCDAALIRRPATASRSRRVHSETPVPAGAAQRSQLRRRGVARLRRLARLTSLVWVAALALLVWGAAPAPAQCWCEDQHGGAGSLPQTAQKTLGSGPLTCIVGRLRSNAIADGGPDLEDMYLLRIDQPGIFTARTVVAPMPPAQPGDVVAFDTQLWLFQVCGDGLLGNDDDPCERAIGFSFIGNASNDGTGVIVKEPGLYLIAVSVHDNDPVSPLGPIFDQASRIEISGPDGLGGGVPISGWSRTAGGVPTDVDLWYRIDLTGCAYAAPFLCPADLNDDGIVDGADLGILLGNWGTMGVGDIDMDGDIDGADLGLLLGGFGFCPPPEGVCGEPNSGSCFEAHGNPACEDACCCEVVCAVDPFCCNVSWDSICAGGAGALCGEGLSDGAVGADGSGADADDAAGGGCLTSCPPCSIPEGEPCGADFNGGGRARPPRPAAARSEVRPRAAAG